MKDKLNYFSAINFLSRYMKDYKKHFFMFYFGWFFDSILTLVMPILFGIMIDEIVYYQNLSAFLQIALTFLVCVLFSGVLYFLIYAQHAYLMNMYVFSIRKDVFSHFQKCKAQYLTNMSTGELLATFQDYSEECMHFVIRNIIHTINGILLIVLYAVYLVIIDWRIGAIALSTAIFSVFINTRFQGKIRRLGSEERELYGKHISWIYEIFTGMRDIRMLGARDKVEDTCETEQKGLYRRC